MSEVDALKVIEEPKRELSRKIQVNVEACTNLVKCINRESKAAEVCFLFH